MQEISNSPGPRASGDLARLSPSALLEHAASHESPPAGLAPEIEALWWDSHGDTERALELLEDERSPDAVWVRAYARRKLGDEAIASFWYAKSKHPHVRGSSALERDSILKELIGGRR